MNVPCRNCGRTDLPLHVNHLCPECYTPPDEHGWTLDYVVSDDDDTDLWRGDWWPDAQPEDSDLVNHPDYH